MRSWIALLALLAACGFGGNGKGDGGVGDDDAPNQFPFCYGSFPRICFQVAPTAPKTFTGAVTVIDTGSTTDCDQQNDRRDRYCVVAGNGFTINNAQKLAAHGSKPLVLLSTAMFDVSGDIDVSSSRNGTQSKGPGADPPDCTAGTPPAGSSGGYGGSFHGKGGVGSEGNGSEGPGGTAPEPLAAFPSMLRGGCPGGNGNTIGTLGEGSGGSGGGAVAIIGMQIHINGRINASGEGGHGGSLIKTGGGGGGSGGMLVIDSSMVQLDSRAAIWANGGGGAQGGAIGMGGNNGDESSGPAVGAQPSTGTALGANGGRGSVGAALTGGTGISDASSGGGGGGGGGGAGFVHVPATADLLVVSPATLELPL
jgi:hypothetical protein